MWLTSLSVDVFLLVSYFTYHLRIVRISTRLAHGIIEISNEDEAVRFANARWSFISASTAGLYLFACLPAMYVYHPVILL